MTKSTTLSINVGSSTGCQTTTYTVTAGDTCYNLAATIGIPLAVIEYLNPNMCGPSLQIGATLMMPTKPGCFTYTVQAGDYPYAIAQAFGFPDVSGETLAIINANNLVCTNGICMIYPGQKLVIPV